MNTDYSNLLIDYLDGNLDVELKAEVEKELAQNPSLQQELEELRLLLGAIEESPNVQPSPSLRNNFMHVLEAEKIKEVQAPARTYTLRPMEWRVAAAISLLVIGTGFGMLWKYSKDQQNQINVLVQEVEMTRKMLVVSMLQNESASDRIQALNMAHTQPADPKIIDALIFTLNNDEHVNVRMKAAEALVEFRHQPTVVEALAKSLEAQESPEVQITLIDILVELGTPKAAPPLQKLIKEDNVLEVVRNKAASGLEILL